MQISCEREKSLSMRRKAIHVVGSNTPIIQFLRFRLSRSPALPVSRSYQVLTVLWCRHQVQNLLPIAWVSRHLIHATPSHIHTFHALPTTSRSFLHSAKTCLLTAVSA